MKCGHKIELVNYASAHSYEVCMCLCVCVCWLFVPSTILFFFRNDF